MRDVIATYRGYAIHLPRAEWGNYPSSDKALEPDTAWLSASWRLPSPGNWMSTKFSNDALAHSASVPKHTPKRGSSPEAQGNE